MLKTNSIIVLIIGLLSCSIATYGQKNAGRHGWYYKKEFVTSYRNPYSVFTCYYYYENNKVLLKQVLETDFDNKTLSSASFYDAQVKGIKEFMYIWYPYDGQIYLGTLAYSANDIDSTYTFHIDGISIKAINFADKYNKPEKRYKMGERYMFDFPSPAPDTIPAFFEKVKEGCPYTPCTVIVND